MPTLKKIAENPHKALNDLEKQLGAKPGSLLRDMDRLASEGESWKGHLPYLMAESYYENAAVRTEYEGHVNACEYCRTLLETLHPSDPQARDFAEAATAAARMPERGKTRRYVPISSAVWAVAASIVVTVIAAASLEPLGVLLSPAQERQGFIDELRMSPETLETLEKSRNPAERYRAAQYYFALEQPQLAYRQIEAGLQLAAPLPISDAVKIATAADVPSSSSAKTLSHAAQQLPDLEATASNNHPTGYLEVARAQAKLGFHDEALQSIQHYLKAKKTDPKVLAQFSVVTPGK